MTQVASNAHRVEIVAAGSNFAVNAASLSPGQMAAFTMPSVPLLSNAGGNDSIFEYVSNFGWDATNRRIRFCGVSHSTGVAKYLEYRDTLNNWIREDIPDGDTQPRHGYCGASCDQAGGEVFWDGNGSSRVMKRTAAGVWSQITSPQAGWTDVIWHPGLARYVLFQIWGIRTFNPANDTFGILRDTPAGTDKSDQPGAAAYNPKDGYAYGGCTITTNPKLWRVSPAGVCTQIANAPVPVGIHYAAGNNAMLCGSTSSANKLLAIRQNAEVYEYDDVGNSWSSALSMPSGWVSFIQGATNNQWIAGPISTHGVIAFFRESPLAIFDSTYWLWKR